MRVGVEGDQLKKILQTREDFTDTSGGTRFTTHDHEHFFFVVANRIFFCVGGGGQANPGLHEAREEVVRQLLRWVLELLKPINFRALLENFAISVWRGTFPILEWARSPQRRA